MSTNNESTQFKTHADKARALAKTLLEASGKPNHDHLTKDVEQLANASGLADPCKQFLDDAISDLKAGDLAGAAKLMEKYAQCEDRPKLPM